MKTWSCHLIAAAGIAGACWLGNAGMHAWGLMNEPASRSSVTRGQWDQRFELPGVRVQHVYGADQIRLPDDHSVIGLSINGEARAYLQDGMAQPRSHIACDQIGGVNVAIVYCDMSGDSRVFAAEREQIDSLKVGGMTDFNLDLLVGNQRYAINATNIPLSDLAFQVMEWGQWKALHPHTEIYAGDCVPGFQPDDAAKISSWPQNL